MSKWNNNNNQRYQYKQKSDESHTPRDMPTSKSMDRMGEKTNSKEPLNYSNPSVIRKAVKQSANLLTDDQMISFIKNGYIVLDSGLPRDFHQFIYDRAESLALSRTNNDGNNILPIMPLLQDVYDSPNVRGALASILGNNYIMHSHRHPHLSPPGFASQQWHKDSYFGYAKPRSHVPRWVMAMYYPQDTVLQMGPTAIAANTQYLCNPKATERHYATLPPGWDAKELHMECKAGTVVIIHYDIWHKGTANKSNINRYMFKFQFIRTQEPTLPTWNCNWNEPLSTPFDSTPNPLAPVWAHIWNWLMGGRKRIDAVSTSRSESDDLKKKLYSSSVEDEPIRLWAAYQLGLETLAKAATDSSEAVMRNACFGLASLGSRAVPKLAELYRSSDEMLRCWVIFALGEIGDPLGLETVEDAVRDKSDIVRRSAVEAIGQIGQSTSVDSLLNAVTKHPNDQVRFSACLSLVQLARAHGEAMDRGKVMEALEMALDDRNRYVRGYAVEVLRCLKFPEAQELLIRELMRSRWDPLTTKNTQW